MDLNEGHQRNYVQDFEIPSHFAAAILGYYSIDQKNPELAKNYFLVPMVKIDFYDDVMKALGKYCLEFEGIISKPKYQ